MVTLIAPVNFVQDVLKAIVARFISINAFGNSAKRIGPSNRKPELFISHNLFYIENSAALKWIPLKRNIYIVFLKDFYQNFEIF